MSCSKCTDTPAQMPRCVACTMLQPGRTFAVVKKKKLIFVREPKKQNDNWPEICAWGKKLKTNGIRRNTAQWCSIACTQKLEKPYAAKKKNKKQKQNSTTGKYYAVA